MKDNPFEYLGELLEKLPEGVQAAATEATKTAVDSHGKAMYDCLKANGGRRLSEHIYQKDNSAAFESGETDTYIYYVDWDDTLVNPNRKTTIKKAVIPGKVHISKTGKVWHSKDRTRPIGKRDYSRVPATWHDLAYILNTPRQVVGKNGKVTMIPAKHFIAQGVRRKNGWKRDQTKIFSRKLAIMAKEFK